MDTIVYLFHKSNKTKGVYSLCSKNKAIFLPKYERINFTKILVSILQETPLEKNCFKRKKNK